MDMAKAKNITNTALAHMIKKGFDGVDRRFIRVEKRLDKLELGQKTLEYGQKMLEQGQEDMKIRLDNVPYRFELVELTSRVTRLEKYAKFKPC